MKLYITRDKDNSLILFEHEPICDDINGKYYSKSGYVFGLPNSYFPEVTFENSPQEIELSIKK